MPGSGTARADPLAHLCVLAVVTPLGFATKLYAGPGAPWVSGYAGGFFYVLFWVFLVLAMAPRSSPPAVAVGVLAVTSALEVLQLWKPPFLQDIRSSFLGHALIGSTFSVWDFPVYALAAWIAPPLARRAAPGSRAAQHPSGSSPPRSTAAHGLRAGGSRSCRGGRPPPSGPDTGRSS